ncbi:spondin domain-containing protein [Rubripirellula reticaptiva]|uniref:Spondin n=1 Tax=Rubripirellula reticaptiva TaxID=2528013 RepID=A0A5C6EV91_9BACT|nr:spondin domain-containing protein [Rubripirellula reticaptiva]TWU51379.1 Spondin [Rubripirellula reticaptiva]
MSFKISDLFASETSLRHRGSAHRRPRSPRNRRIQVETLERRQLLAAEVLQITVENLSDDGGLAQTPFWVAAHDGTFDLGDPGQPASSFGGLELIAEDGDVSGLVDRFTAEGVGNAAVIAAPGGFTGAPVFEPGEVVTQDLTVDDTTASPFFSFASMVIPANDAFIANLDATAIRLFDADGDFLGPQTIVVYGSQIWDAGTEVNDPVGGAAFTTVGGTSADEGGVIALHQGLDGFVGESLPTGETLTKAFGANTPIARITVARASDPTNPIDQAGPLAALDASDVAQRIDSHEISVTFSDPSGVDLSSITPENLRITGPLLTQLEVLSVVVNAGSATTLNEVTANYRVAPASGSFTHLDNGTYSVVLLADQVGDSFGHAATAEMLGDFTVSAPVQLQVTYESLADEGGLSQTPIWVAVHDGNFEIARAGRSASDFGGLESLAEDGDVSGLVDRFAADANGYDAVIVAPDGFPDAPVFEPSETVSQTLNVFDAFSNRFFSFASMVIPSNDAFIANLDPRSYELFDRFGNFTGARTITIYGQDVWDAGTEENDPIGDAAFSTEGGTATDENGVVGRHRGLNDFVGTELPTGGNLTRAFENRTPVGRFTISLADLPADPIDHLGPIATTDVTGVTIVGQTTHEVRVTYSDPSGVDITSIDTSDIRIISSTGKQLQIVGVTADADGTVDRRSVTATYQVAPVDGDPFNTLDNGLYIINSVAGEVGDKLGNEIGLASLGSFEIHVAVQLNVTIENLSIDGGLAQTPFWIAVHEGNFSIAAAGESAIGFGGLEALAEEGDVSGLDARFATESNGFAAVVTAPGGFAGAPVFEPGETASLILDVQNTNANRFFSFASMVIPSNDAFIANFNARAYELFDSNGFFNGPKTITIYGRDIWDAGTEVNGVGSGAAFSAEGGNGVDENGVIRRHSGLDEFIETGLPTGSDLAAAFIGQTPLARITIGLAGETVIPEDDLGPTTFLSAQPITVAGAAEHEVKITFNDPAGVDITSIDPSDLNIVGPGGSTLRVTNVVVDAAEGTSPRSVVATYQLATSDDQFTARNNGTYRVSLANDAVRDTLGQGSSLDVAGVVNVDVGIRLQVDVESLTEAGGLAGTPFWVGFHDGQFEVARGGASASEFGGLELLAEEGDASELVARFAAESNGTDSLITAPDGFAGAPVFEPGETAGQVIEIANTADNRFFSFASMVIPSNDAFIANLNSQAYELFDRLGNFKGARRITIYGRDILDAGTEANDASGAAFSTEGGVGTVENGVIRKHTGLDNFIGTGLPTGENLGSAFGQLTAIATITISLFDPEAEACSGVDAACSARSVSLQNSALSADVNKDGQVSALDALLVINFLGRFGNQSTIADEAQRAGLDLDVGGDTEVTALDALQVINELARRRGAGGESESVSETEQALRFDVAIGQLSQSDSFDFGYDQREEALTLLF